MTLALVTVLALASCSGAAKVTPSGVLSPQTPRSGAALQSSALATPGRYTITEIGPPAAFENAFAINEHGNAAGHFDAAPHVPHMPPPVREGFAYIHGVSTSLPPVGGKRHSTTAAINERDHVVGWSYSVRFALDAHATLWQGAVGTDLHSQVSFGGDASYASGINASGHITGDSTTLGEAEDHAWLLRHGAVQDLGTLGGTVSAGIAINEDDLVVGYAFTKDNAEQHAAMWHGTIRDLGTLGGTAAQASAVNEDGAIAGSSTLPGDAVQHAFVYRHGHMVDIHPAGFPQNSTASGMNNRGDIVGNASPTLDDHFAGNLALLWHRGNAVDLNTQIADPTWQLFRAAGINDRGQIVGVGKHNGVVRAFILTPRDNDNDNEVQSQHGRDH